MKIEKITLYKQELVEQDGEYKIEVSEVEEVPCVITNRALQMAKQMGVTSSSLATDLMVLTGEMPGQPQEIEDERILKAIYVGYIGGQLLLGESNPQYSYDEFLDRYNDDTVERIILYQSLLVKKDNKFAKEVQRATSKTVGKGEKKQGP